MTDCVSERLPLRYSSVDGVVWLSRVAYPGEPDDVYFPTIPPSGRTYI